MPIKDFYTTVKDYWGHVAPTSKKDEVLVGLEFENESIMNFQKPNVPGWVHHHEGSLRHYGFEYVLEKPELFEKSLLMIKTLFDRIDQARGAIELTNSIRTSMHVHFDVRQYNYFDVIRFALAYWLVEDMLTEYAGEHRKGNLFCLRLKEASWTQQSLIDKIHTRYPWKADIFSDNYRYASLNLASISKFGSLEFRLMRGTNSPSTAQNWVKILNKIRLFSWQFKTPLELREYVIKREFTELPQEIFGTYLWEKISSKLPKGFSVQKSLRQAFLALEPLFSAHDTWDFTQDLREEERSRELALKKYKNIFAGSVSDEYLNDLLDSYDNDIPDVIVQSVAITHSPVSDLHLDTGVDQSLLPVDMNHFFEVVGDTDA